MKPDLVAEAQRLTRRPRHAAARSRCPADVVVAQEFSATAEADVRKVDAVGADEMILDIGPDTADMYAEHPQAGRHHRVERPGGRVRVRPVRRGHARVWRKPSPAARRSPSPAAATPWRRWTSTAWPTASPMYPPAAVRSWNSSKARRLPAVAMLEERARTVRRAQSTASRPALAMPCSTGA